MKYAPVVPEYVLPALPKDHDYHLVLSNELMRSPAMQDYYRGRGFVIMDNPVHERLDIPSLEMRAYMMVKIMPSVMVASDVIGDGHATYDKYLEERRTFASVPLMAVVQGKNMFDYVFSIMHLAEHAEYIGVPLIRKYEPICRAKFVYTLSELGFFDKFPNTKIHLLGCDSTYGDIAKLAGLKHPNVMGFDSAKPIYLALKGYRADSVIDPKSEAWGRPDWYFSRTDPLTPPEADLIRHNVEVMYEWLS